MELSAGSHGLPGRGRGSGISAARHWVSHPTGVECPEMGAPGTETPTQKRPRTYSRHGLNTLRRALTASVPGGEAGGESHPLTRGGSGEFREWGFVYAQTTLHVVETTTVRWWSFRLSAPGEIEAANGPYRGKKGTVLVGLGGYQMFDSLAIDRDGHICVATFISGVEIGAKGRPLRSGPSP